MQFLYTASSPRVPEPCFPTQPSLDLSTPLLSALTTLNSLSYSPIILPFVLSRTHLTLLECPPSVSSPLFHPNFVSYPTNLSSVCPSLCNIPNSPRHISMPRFIRIIGCKEQTLSQASPVKYGKRRGSSWESKKRTPCIAALP